MRGVSCCALRSRHTLYGSPGSAGHELVAVELRRGPIGGTSGFPRHRGRSGRPRMTRHFLEVHMKRVISFGAVALLFLAAADATAQGKLSGFGAVGATTPTGDLKDIDGAKSGFGVQAGLEYKLTAPLWLRFDGMMSFNGIEST